MEPTYMNGNGAAEIGHLVMTPGDVRAIVIEINRTFVKVHGFGTHKETGELVILNWVHDLPASQCALLEDQSLTSEIKQRLGMPGERERSERDSWNFAVVGLDSSGVPKYIGWVNTKKGARELRKNAETLGWRAVTIYSADLMELKDDD